MPRPGAEQEPGPASGPNPYVNLIAVAVMGSAFGLARKQMFRQGLDGNQESTQRTHQRQAIHTRGRRGGRGGQSTVSALSSRKSDLDTVKTARVGADCSRPSNQHNRGESPWRHRRCHQAMTLSLYPSSPQLEPGEHCACTQNYLWVLSHGTLLSGVKRDQSSVAGSAHHQPHIPGGVSSSLRGCRRARVPALHGASFILLGPSWASASVPRLTTGGRAESLPLCAHATRN